MSVEKLLKSPALDPKFVTCLRLIEPEDAALICELRADPNLNRHISQSQNDVAAQAEWIKKYKTREANGEEYYFIITHKGESFGAIRMYDFTSDPLSFAWGSWIIKPTRPSGLVTMSAVMIYEVGLDALGFDQAHFDVRKENTGVVNFHLRSGAIETHESEIDNFYKFPNEIWPAFREKSAQQIEAHRTLR